MKTTIGIQRIVAILMVCDLVAGPAAFAQRPTPGASSGPPSGTTAPAVFDDDPNASSPSAPSGPSSSGASSSGSSALSSTASDAAKAQLGSYVELDDSIKNELYGTIDFPNAELKDIIKAISKLANKNFILDRKIENRRVTIISPNPVTKQEAYNAFLSALYMNDLTLVPIGKFLKIVEAKAAIQSNIRVFYGDYAPANEEIVTLLYPLKYLNAEEVQRYLTDLVPRNGRVSSYPNTNTLVMTDTGLNLRRIIAILKSIDVPGHEDQLATIPIRYASAKGIAQLIDDILSAQQTARGVRPSARNQPQKTRGGGIITKIVPDERTNSLVILANGRGVQELRNLVAKLDNPDAAGGGNIHVYYAKNAVAEELATTINSLVSGAKPNTNNGPGNTLPPPPGVPFNNSRFSNSNSSGGGDGDGVRFEGNIKVTADKPTNSLVIVASGSDYAALRRILQKLDIPRRQVYVEGTIMEIRTSDARKLNSIVNIAQPGRAQAGGFNPLSPDAAAAAASGTAILQGLVAAITGGGTVKVGNTTVPTVTALINALVTNTQAQILHQPQILTSDNQDAEIKVTNKIAVPQSSTQTSASGVSATTTFTKEDVVVSLKITPQLGVGNDLVKLKVDQSVDDFSPAQNGAGSGQIDVTQRKANTSVVVRDGDTVVIGGLQRSRTSDEDNKFPILGDIPILGRLFRGSSTTVERSDLVLFLTPHIINEYGDLLKITERRINDREKLGAEQHDPSDRMAKQVQELKAVNRANMLREPPKGWGFSPRQDSHGIDRGDEDEDSGSDEATQTPPTGSAYIEPTRPAVTPPPAQIPPSSPSGFPPVEATIAPTPSAPSALLDDTLQNNEDSMNLDEEDDSTAPGRPPTQLR